MKMTLNQNIVLRLTLDKKPHDILNGKVEYQVKPKGTDYILYDNHRDAPIGFGVKVGKTKKTVVIQK